MHEVFVHQSVPKPNFVVDWLKGFKSDIGYWEPFVKNVSEGCVANVEVMGFGDPQTRINFLPPYRQASFDRFFWQQPQKNLSLPHIAGAHSLGAFLLLEHLIDDEKAKIFRENYDGLFLANPFLGDPWHDSMLCRAFSNYKRVKDKPTGSTTIERWFGPKLTSEFSKNPTHQQSLFLHDQATGLLEKIIENEGLSPVLNGMPIAIIAGENDTACHNEKIYDFGAVMGIKVYTYADTAHNPLLCDRDALNHFKYWANQVANGKQLKPLDLNPMIPA